MWRNRAGALLLGVSGLLFMAFPILRPFGDQRGLQAGNLRLVAETLASSAWLLSHLLAGLAFVLLIFGALAVYARLATTRSEPLAFAGLVALLGGIALLIPVIALEAVALREVAAMAPDGAGAFAVRVGDVRLVGGPMLLAGLLLLAAGGILTAMAIWRTNLLPRWAGITFAVGLALFLPVLPQPVRIADGLAIMFGSVFLARALWIAQPNIS